MDCFRCCCAAAIYLKLDKLRRKLSVAGEDLAQCSRASLSCVSAEQAMTASRRQCFGDAELGARGPPSGICSICICGHPGWRGRGEEGQRPLVDARGQLHPALLTTCLPHDRQVSLDRRTNRPWHACVTHRHDANHDSIRSQHPVPGQILWATLFTSRCIGGGAHRYDKVSSGTLPRNNVGREAKQDTGTGDSRSHINLAGGHLAVQPRHHASRQTAGLGGSRR